MIIHSYENGRRADACIEYIRGLKCLEKTEQLFLLPIPTTRDNKVILGTNIYIDSLYEAFSESCLIVGYSLSEGFKSKAVDAGCLIHDVGCDEEFLCENAQLTAEATLGILLNSSVCALSDMSIGVVGYGRIGKRLTRLLLYLGASVKVYSSSDNKRIDLGEWGVATAESASGADLSDIDVLINTAPAVIFDTTVSGIFPHSVRVIDLASGNNFPGLSAVEKYPSIPAKMFPATAGRAWGRSIERFMNEKIYIQGEH